MRQGVPVSAGTATGRSCCAGTTSVDAAAYAEFLSRLLKAIGVESQAVTGKGVRVGKVTKARSVRPGGLLSGPTGRRGHQHSGSSS